MHIRNTKELDAALDRLDTLWGVREGQDGWEDRVALVEAVAEFEDRESEPALPDPVDAILFRMEQAGLRQQDLVPYIGSRSKVSEVLNRKRQLSKAMIVRLHEGLGIPLASLHGIESAYEETASFFMVRSRQRTTTLRGRQVVTVRSLGGVTFAPTRGVPRAA